MQPPQAPAIPGNEPAAAFARLQGLKQRRDFLAAARAKKQVTPGFILQARNRLADDPADTAIRVGFTASKKVGNAVARNRAKRRLRALAREILPKSGHPGWDYVLIARKEATASRPFAQIQQDLRQALTRLHS